MKIRNPNYKSAEQIRIEQWAVAMSDYLMGKAADLEFITLDDLRRDFPAQASLINEGRIEEVCQALGLEIAR